MKFSAPIYFLKRQAKLLSRREGIPLHGALDRIARAEGFSAWSLLAARASESRAGKVLMAELSQGELVLMGARPGHGKTLLSLEFAVEAMRGGQRGVFFSLEYADADIDECFAAIGEERATFGDRFEFDNSDAISASYIIDRLQSEPAGTVVIVDYLQALDQKRENPDLMAQVQALKAFASAQGLIMVFISQIDRRYDPAQRPCPGLKDVRLPNPLELTLFDKACFLQDGEGELAAVG